MKNVVGIGHIAIRVKDIDRTLDFYRDKLGFKEMFRLDRDGKLWLMYLRVTDTQYIELFPEAVGDSAPGREANGLNHLCLEVDSLDATLAELDEGGRSDRAGKADGRRWQSAGVDRGSRRQPHRADADGPEEHAERGAGAAPGRGVRACVRTERP